MQIKLVLAEDSAAVRGAIVDVLKGDSRIEVVGQAETLAQMLEFVATLTPDVLILDLHMPDDREFLPEFLKRNCKKQFRAFWRCPCRWMTRQSRGRKRWAPKSCWTK